MKKLLIPTAVLPYIVCLCLGYGVISQNFSDNTILILGIVALVTLVLSFVCNIIFILTTKSKSSMELLRTTLLIKAIHIPTYIVIFIFGAMLGVMFFMTFPIILLLVLIDYLTLWMSGMISIYAHIRVIKEKRISSTAPVVISMICQLFFCLDIISLIVIYVKGKEKA